MSRMWKCKWEQGERKRLNNERLTTDERWKIWNLSLARSLCLFKRVSVESVAAEMDWVDGIDR